MWSVRPSRKAGSFRLMAPLFSSSTMSLGSTSRSSRIARRVSRSSRVSGGPEGPLSSGDDMAHILDAGTCSATAELRGIGNLLHLSFLILPCGRRLNAKFAGIRESLLKRYVILLARRRGPMRLLKEVPHGYTAPAAWRVAAFFFR